MSDNKNKTTGGIKSPSATLKNKKIVTTFVIGGAILCLLMLAMYISDPKKGEPDALNNARENAEQSERNFSIDPSSTVESEEAWQTKSEDAIHLTKSKVGNVATEVETLKEVLEAERKRNEEKQAAMLAQIEELRSRPAVVEKVVEKQVSRPTPIPPSVPNRPVQQRQTGTTTRSLPPPPSVNGLNRSQLAQTATQLNGQNNAASIPVQGQPQSTGIKHITGSSEINHTVNSGLTNNTNVNSLGKKGTNRIKSIKNVKNYVPAGSFGRVILLSGVDAPTGGLAKSNPVPVLMRIKDKGTLANHFKSDLEECTVIGAAAGDMASERANIRLESITCVLVNGQIIEKKLKGYVSGDDGKAGFRGRIVSKQGAILAKSALAGLAGGIGKASTQQYQNIQSSALGTVTTIDPNKVVQAGFTEGLGNAMNKIAEFYIARANETYPIIEISAGRIGELVLTHGVDMGVDHLGKKRKG